MDEIDGRVRRGREPDRLAHGNLLAQRRAAIGEPLDARLSGFEQRLRVHVNEGVVFGVDCRQDPSLAGKLQGAKIVPYAPAKTALST